MFYSYVEIRIFANITKDVFHLINTKQKLVLIIISHKEHFDWRKEIQINRSLYHLLNTYHNEYFILNLFCIFLHTVYILYVFYMK